MLCSSPTRRSSHLDGIHHRRAVAASVPLRNVCRDHRRRAACREDDGVIGEPPMTFPSRDIFGAALTRRRFIQGGGALVVGLAFSGALPRSLAAAANPTNSPDATK